MSDNITGRFNQVRSGLDAPFRAYQVVTAEDGTIIFRQGKLRATVLGYTFLIFAAALALLVLRNWGSIGSPLNYVSIVPPVGFIVLIIFLAGVNRRAGRSGGTYCAIDPVRREITVYGLKPHFEYGPTHVIQLGDIKLFMAYIFNGRDRGVIPERNIYGVMNDGLTYCVLPGSLLPPTALTRLIAYICEIQAVEIFECVELMLGPVSTSTVCPRYDGICVDVARLLSKGKLLYDPKSGVNPDWVKG